MTPRATINMIKESQDNRVLLAFYTLQGVERCDPVNCELQGNGIGDHSYSPLQQLQFMFGIV